MIGVEAKAALDKATGHVVSGITFVRRIAQDHAVGGHAAGEVQIG